MEGGSPFFHIPEAGSLRGVLFQWLEFFWEMVMSVSGVLGFVGLVRRGFGVWREFWLSLGLAVLVAMVAVGAASWLVVWPFVHTGLNGLARVVVQVVLGGPLLLGLVRMALSVHDAPLRRVSVLDVFGGLRCWIPGALLALVNAVAGVVAGLLGLIPFVGVVLHLALAVSFGTATMFAFFFLADRDLPVIEAVAASVGRVSRGFVRHLVLLFVVAAIGAGPVLLVGLAGAPGLVLALLAFFSAPLALCVLTAAYRAGDEPGDGAV